MESLLLLTHSGTRNKLVIFSPGVQFAFEDERTRKVGARPLGRMFSVKKSLAFIEQRSFVLDQKGLMGWSCRPSVCLSRFKRVSCQVEHCL